MPPSQTQSVQYSHTGIVKSTVRPDGRSDKQKICSLKPTCSWSAMNTIPHNICSSADAVGTLLLLSHRVNSFNEAYS